MNKSGAIGAYEKFVNFFRLKVNPEIRELFVIPESELQKFPLCWRKDRGTHLWVSGHKEFSIVPATSKDVKNLLRHIICTHINGARGWTLRKRGTVIVNTSQILKKYGNGNIIAHPACEFRVWHIAGTFFLCLDFCVFYESNLTVDAVLKLLGQVKPGDLGYCKFDLDGQLQTGKPVSLTPDSLEIEVAPGTFVSVNPAQAIPILPRRTLAKVVRKDPAYASFFADEKKLSLLTVDAPGRQRLEWILRMATQIRSAIFPLTDGQFTFDMHLDVTPLLSPVFDVRTDVEEARVCFDRDDYWKATTKIIEGLIKYGAYEKPGDMLNLVLLCTHDHRQAMENLVKLLKEGSFRYKGFDKTFGVSLNILDIVTAVSYSDYVEHCHRLIKSKYFSQTHVLLFYIDEETGKEDYDSPYYEVKKILLRNGLPSQAVDEETLADLKFKDLNLALDIFAKAGYVPWVLVDELQDVDLFIGLSHSSIMRNGRIERMMAYVNVFDEFGRWRFYQGSACSFPFEERLNQYKTLVKDSIYKYKGQNPSAQLASIHVHYTRKLSWEERQEIFEAAREVIPECRVTFVYINLSTPLRLFNKATKDGSMERGVYVLTSPNQFLICTTGRNLLEETSLGTPRPLLVSTLALPEGTQVNLTAVAQHILSLTKLNWASSRPLCHEPITTRFARRIAYFMDVFMADPNFAIDVRLNNKPWFL